MNDPLLSVQNLSVAFDHDKQTTLVVDDISFDIAKGETLALVGESGSGKSVSALSILKLLPYPAASHPSGKIFFEGKELLSSKEKDLRHVRGNKISMIFQEPMTSLNPLHTVSQQVVEALRTHKSISRKKALEKTFELFTAVCLRDPAKRMNSFPHELSGGQRQRVMIAMALANEPDLLIADEPTTAVDVTIQAQILALLYDLKKKNNMSMLFITHNLGIVRKIADRVCVMKDGRIIEDNKTSSLFKSPQHQYTQHLLSSEPKDQMPPPDKTSQEFLSGKNIRVWFPIKKGFFRGVSDYVKAVDGVDISIKSSQTLGIVGESGSGKTTLGLALIRMIASQGEISFRGLRLDSLSFRKMRPLRRELQIVFQDPFGSLSPRMSVSEIIQEGMKIHEPHLSSYERDVRVVKVLEEVNLDPDSRFRYPHEFSGGQRQRIAIARAIILKPKFIMLDEPTSALDMSVQAQLIDLFRNLQKKYGISFLFISHDLKIVRALAHDIIVMNNGKIVDYGSTNQIFESPSSEYTKALIAAAFHMEAVSVEYIRE